MKRYEKMTKEEIMAISKGFMACEHCIVHDSCDGSRDCTEMYEEYMAEEIEMIPRVYTFKTAKEAFEYKKNYFVHYDCCKINCNDCKYSCSKNDGVPCEYNWFFEEVEK